MTKPALLLIDVQKAFDDPVWGKRNNPDAEGQIANLLAAWRAKDLPVIHVQHCSTEPNSTLRPEMPGNAFKDEAQPHDGEAVFKKNVNSAFIGTNLEAHLREHGIESLVVVGLTTDHCVSTSVRMAGNLGFTVTLVADACATFDRHDVNGAYFTAEAIHDIHLASLNDEFCTVRKADQVLAEL